MDFSVPFGFPLNTTKKGYRASRKTHASEICQQHSFATKSVFHQSMKSATQRVRNGVMGLRQHREPTHWRFSSWVCQLKLTQKRYPDNQLQCVRSRAFRPSSARCHNPSGRSGIMSFVHTRLVQGCLASVELRQPHRVS